MLIEDVEILDTISSDLDEIHSWRGVEDYEMYVSIKFKNGEKYEMKLTDDVRHWLAPFVYFSVSGIPFIASRHWMDKGLEPTWRI